MRWQIAPRHYSLAVKRKLDGAILIIDVSRSANPRLWMAMAISTPNADNVLDDHAHESLGTEFTSRRKAELAGEKYARQWLKGATGIKCNCGPIAEAVDAAGKMILDKLE